MIKIGFVGPFEAHCILSVSFSRKFLTSLHWSKTLRFPHSAVTLLDWTVTFAKLSELLIFDAPCHMFLPLFPRSFSNICIALSQSFSCSFSIFSVLFINLFLAHSSFFLALSQCFHRSFSIFVLLWIATNISPSPIPRQNRLLCIFPNSNPFSPGMCLWLLLPILCQLLC